MFEKILACIGPVRAEGPSLSSVPDENAQPNGQPKHVAMGKFERS